MLVAGNAGIGRPPSLVFLTEVVDHRGPKFLSETNLSVGNAQDAADILGPVCLVIAAGGVPQTHMHAPHFVASLVEQQGSHGGALGLGHRH